MDRMISASVGRNGRNHPNDVVTIQKLLNELDPGVGGASPKLKVDGKCGSKTRAAIQKFQLNQFGWKFADGRVDPGGPTLQRMNEWVGGRTSWKKSSSFQIRRNFPDSIPSRPGMDAFFEVHDVQNHRRAIFIFVSTAYKQVQIPSSLIPMHFSGRWSRMKATVPVSLLEMEGPATLKTDVRPGPPGIRYIFETRLGVRCQSGKLGGDVWFRCSVPKRGYFRFVGVLSGVT